MRRQTLRMIFILRSLILPCLFLLSLLACSSSNAPSGGDGPNENLAGQAASVYPHPDNQREIHGQAVVENGYEICLRCHQKEVGPEEGGAPACYSHHPGVPHDDKIIDEHPAMYREKGKEYCQRCHMVGDQGNPAGIPCNSHHAYPHPDNWAAADQHGPAGEGEGKLNCDGARCHGEDFLGRGAANSCLQHHALYPVPHLAPEWMNGTPPVHGATYRANPLACKTQCHGADLTGGLSETSCFDHHSYPHPADWHLPANHGPAAYGAGKDNCDGANCHKADFTGNPPAVPSCFTHHTVYPHRDPNWTAEGNASIHASTFIAGYRNDPNICKGCHGQNYERELAGKSCLSATCHPQGVTHTAGWYNAEPLQAEHGRYLSNGNNYALINSKCNKCHMRPAGSSPITFADTNKAVRPNEGQPLMRVCTHCHSLGHNSAFLPDPNLVNSERNQSKASLAQTSDCLRHHWAYPHSGYAIPGTGAGLEPAMGWGPTTVAYRSESHVPINPFGHVYYLIRNPLLLDANDNHPIGGILAGEGNNDEQVLVRAAIQKTCAGQIEGLCHNNARLIENNIDINATLCTTFCHLDN